MRTIVALLTLGTALSSCNSGSDKKGSSPQPQAAQKGADGTNTQAVTSNSPNDGFFTGFDGKTDYSILIPQFRSMSIDDPSVARIEQVKVKLSEATIQSLVQEAKAKNPNFDTVRFQRMFQRENSVNKIIPLKPGRTVIKTSGGRGGQTGRNQSGWGKSPNIDLVVTGYTEEQFNAGKVRYETDGGGGSLKACKSCHETGEQGAPPHELGKIMELNDKDALSWFKTGQAKGRTAKIEHKWGFSSDLEEAGILAFMRAKQTNDVESLTKLVFEEFIANGFPAMPSNIPGPAPGSGTGTASGTGTGTGTASGTGSGGQTPAGG
jgi:hypothetical protein